MVSLTAVAEELEALRKNGTWETSPTPLTHKLLGCKWVLTTKRQADGTFIKRKARLVAQGFGQVPGRDFTHTESPVADRATLRVVLAISAARGNLIHQLDVTTAYLHGQIDTPNIFMRVPVGLNVPPGHALRLQKGLYGLRQAGRIWY